MEFTPSSPPGAFRMRGVESDLYLAMDEKGRLYGEADRLSSNVLFTEHAQVRWCKKLGPRLRELLHCDLWESRRRIHAT